MHDYPIYNLPQSLIQHYFSEIPKPPRKLFARGVFPHESHFVFLTIVGSRNATSYGEQVVKKLIEGLRGYPVVIVSGLAVGIDSIAHHAAIDAQLPVIAFPGSGLGEKTIYPRSNYQLAQKILQANGCIVSEYPEHQHGNSWTFPERNRLMAGIAKATLLIEATHKSGSRITARLATEYNRDVFAVPGDIFRTTSEAPNELIRIGALPITSSEELLEALGFHITEQPMLDLFSQASSEEQQVLKLLASPKTRGDLIRELGFPTHLTNILISQMELKGLIKDMGGELRRN